MKRTILLLSAIIALSAFAKERIILVNEGMWQTDNGRLTYFEDGKVVSNQWFRDINGKKLGDTPNDIIRVNDNLIAIALNWSNIIQFITPDGKAAGATEDVPNNRKLATDGEYVYVTSYAHEVKIEGAPVKFTKGYVAKIDVETLKVVDAVEVGYEPEGIAYYKGHLFVANSGGYAFQEGHNYESIVSVIDASAMEVVRTVDTEQINLYSKMSQSGPFLCINSPGDYYEVSAASIIFDCDAALEGLPDEECFVSLPYAATANCTDMDGNFMAVGSRYSYITGEYKYNYCIINPQEVLESGGEEGVKMDFPGTVKRDIAAMTMPYSIFVNPYTGYIYATDSGEYTGAGALYQWSPQGEFLGKFKTYINPAHFLALPETPNSDTTGIGAIESETLPDTLHDLFGRAVNHPVKGNIYIRNHTKIIY